MAMAGEHDAFDATFQTMAEQSGSDRCVSIGQTASDLPR